MLVINVLAQESVQWKTYSANQPNGDVTLVFEAAIVSGFHLYSPYNPPGASMPLTIKLEQSEKFSTDGKIGESPKPEEHFEEIFGVTEKFFNGKAVFKILITPKSSDKFQVSGKIKGQVCNDEFMCQMVSHEFTIDVTPSKPEPKKDTPKTSDAASQRDKPQGLDETQKSVVADTPAPKTPEPDTVAQVLPVVQQSSDNHIDTVQPDGGESLWSIFLIAFLAGLAAIFTPCVFPMIPMTVSFFLKDKSGKGKLNALVYGLSIVALYTLPVAVIILISNLLGGASFTAGVFNALSTHWLPNVIFFVVFMIFALSFLGMFEIVMPSSLINRAEKRGDKGGMVGIFFLAFVLVLVSFSCTGPIVGSVLVESASGNNFLKPIIAILGFSIAFALPFTLFAFFPDLMKRLPRSGGWLNTVKVVLGFVELALGLKFLSVADQTYHWHILDRETYLAIWIAIGLLLTLYLLGKIKLPNDSDMPFLKVPRLILAIITLSFTVYMIPGLWGAPLKALSGYIPPLTTQDFVVSGSDTKQNSASPSSGKSILCGTPKYSDLLTLPHGMQGYFDYDEALSCALSQNKPLLLVFTGHGCVNCRKMEENVWSDPRVRAVMQNDYVLCALYTDDRSISSDGERTIGEVNTELQISRFNINAQPYYVILDPHNPDAPVKTPQGYNPDVQSFIEYLE